MENGSLILEQDGSASSRWCTTHGVHGLLYICETYSEEIKKKILAMTNELQMALLSGDVTYHPSYAARVHND